MEDTYIPIPHYPPFKLRSSLIDKDPVIWVHLLEGYIQLCQVLLSGKIKLNVKSQHQFQLFLKVYLAETSEETTRIFSLGAINPEIRKNTALLRAYVLQVIKLYSVVKVGLGPESLWHFVLVYVEKNTSLVRRLIDGSFKSPMNDNKKLGKISLVPVLRKHLAEQIGAGKFSLHHLKYLAMLLGQQTTGPVQKFLLSGAKTSKKIVSKDKNKTAGVSFAETFVNEDWIEALERLYAGGKSVHAHIVKLAMVISVLSLSPAKLAKVMSVLGISSSGTLAMSPLLSAIILSEPYKEMNPGLEERLPFLRSISLKTAPSVNMKDVEFLVDMFPALTELKAKTVLLENDGNVEKVTNVLLENPLLVDSIADFEEAQKKEITVSQAELERGLARFSLQENETTEVLGKQSKEPEKASAEEMKKRTLSAALKLLYESDEDERDDTYDDQEHTSGAAFYEYEKKPKNKEKARLAVFEDENETVPETQGSPAPAPPVVDKNELNLFGYFKAEGEAAFDKTSRKSKIRGEMKNATKWTDEQIEGWFRMLHKSPKRFRLLEEQYVFHFSNKRRTQRDADVKETRKPSTPTPTDRRTQARKEKNKAVVGNHNRKGRHNRKAQAELAGMQ